MQLTASVECGKFIKADRGTLTFTDGQLRFETGGRVLFDVPLSSAEKIMWHSYSLGGAFEAIIGGQSYFLSFVPRGARLGVWYAGLSTGRQWRDAMEGRPAPSGPHPAARLFVISYQVVLVFVLACFALLALGAAIEPATPIYMRIISAVSAVALSIISAILIGNGIKSIYGAIRGRK